MSKLHYNRPNRDFYAQKFCEKTGSGKDWPPQDGAMPGVNHRLGDLLLHEAREVMKPQLENLKLTLPSHEVMLIVIDNVNSAPCKTPAEHYNNVSDNVFTLIEKAVPALLGQDETSDWAFVNDEI